MLCAAAVLPYVVLTGNTFDNDTHLVATCCRSLSRLAMLTQTRDVTKTLSGSNK